MTLRLISAAGLIAIVFIAWLMSSSKKQVPWRVIFAGITLQLVLAVLTLKTTAGQWLFSRANELVGKLMSFVDQGTSFLVTIRWPPGAPVEPNQELMGSFLFGVLPTIIFFSTLMSVLYHLGVMQFLVKSIARLMQFTLKTSGPETLSASANIFVGQTEAPLVIKPYLLHMTRSELNAMMVGGFATVTGSLIGAYSRMGVDVGDILTACVISAPASLLIAKVMVPETEPEKTLKTVDLALPSTSPNLVGAAAQGASDGLYLALNVGAMLIAFLALIALVDWSFGQVGIMLGFVDRQGNATWTLEAACGFIFWPFAWLMGIPASECQICGQLLGMRMVTNEFIAYQELGTIIATKDQAILSERSIRIMTYALCGFANFSAIGIQVGGIGSLAPDRRTDLAQLGFRAMLGGTLACLMTGCVAGILL